MNKISKTCNHFNLSCMNSMTIVITIHPVGLLEVEAEVNADFLVEEVAIDGFINEIKETELHGTPITREMIQILQIEEILGEKKGHEIRNKIDPSLE